jgi:hypothetical protein
MRSFYQDRLGTTIGKTPKSAVFVQIATPPRCPPNTTGFAIRRMEYRGARMDYVVTEGKGATLALAQDEEEKEDEDEEDEEEQQEESAARSLVLSIDGAVATPLSSSPTAIPAGSTARVFIASP